MGSNIGKNVQLIDTVVRAVKEVAKKPVWVKLTPTTTNIAKEAEAAFNAGADSITSSNTFTSLPPIDPRVAGVRGERRRHGVVRRPRRPGDPAAVARQDGADDDGVSRQELLRDRRHLRLLAGAELLPARLRHGAGLHGGDARSRDRAERHQGAAVGDAGVPRQARRQGLALARRLPRPAPRPHRRALARSSAPTRRNTTAATSAEGYAAPTATA